MASNSAAEGVSMGDDYEALIATTDAELLKRAWRNEKAAPEILRYESDLVSRVKKVIQFLVRNRYFSHLKPTPPNPSM